VVCLALLGAACSSAGSAPTEPPTSSAPTTTISPTSSEGDGTTTTLAGHPMAGEGSENPMPVGASYVVGHWDIAVRERGVDEPPVVFDNPDGTFLVGVAVQARWLGGVDAGSLPVLSDEVRFFALGADGRGWPAEAERCPARLPWDEPGLFPEGNLCFTLPLAAAAEIQLIAVGMGAAAPGRAFFATDASPEVHCPDGACSVRYLTGPDLTRDQFLATDVGRVLESAFVGGDAEAENAAFLETEGFSVVSDSLVLGYRNGRPVSFFRLEGNRVVSWGTGDGGARLVSGDLGATGWQPIMPVDPEATTVPIRVSAGACVTDTGYEVLTQVRSVEVVEDSASVQVVVWTAEEPWPGWCAGIGLDLDAEVHLAAPLGDRTLVDAGVFPTVNESLQCPMWTERLPEQDLPEEVAAAREAIYLAALYCDWGALEELAMAGGGIEYGSGALGWAGDPVPYWKRAGGGTEGFKHPLWYLARMLELPFATVEGDDGQILAYLWPAVAAEAHRTQADWEQLRGVYSDEAIEAFRTGHEGYAGGFVVGIRPDGTWALALVVSV
jgi:hypothetical protein